MVAKAVAVIQAVRPDTDTTVAVDYIFTAVAADAESNGWYGGDSVTGVSPSLTNSLLAYAISTHVKDYLNNNGFTMGLLDTVWVMGF